MNKIPIPTLPAPQTVQDLHRSTITAFQNLVNQINSTPDTTTIKSLLDVSNNRITNVGDPSTELDAVNLHTLKKGLANPSSFLHGLSIVVNTATAAPGNTQDIIFNNGGLLDASDNFKWDDSARQLVLFAPNNVDSVNFQVTSNAFVLTGKAANNGNIVLQPGNVSGLASVDVLQPRSDTPGFTHQTNYAPFNTINFNDMSIYALASNSASLQRYILSTDSLGGTLHLSTGTNTTGLNATVNSLQIDGGLRLFSVGDTGLSFQRYATDSFSRVSISDGGALGGGYMRNIGYTGTTTAFLHGIDGFEYFTGTSGTPLSALATNLTLDNGVRTAFVSVDQLKYTRYATETFARVSIQEGGPLGGGYAKFIHYLGTTTSEIHGLDGFSYTIGTGAASTVISTDIDMAAGGIITIGTSLFTQIGNSGIAAERISEGYRRFHLQDGGALGGGNLVLLDYTGTRTAQLGCTTGIFLSTGTNTASLDVATGLATLLGTFVDPTQANNNIKILPSNTGASLQITANGGYTNFLSASGINIQVPSGQFSFFQVSAGGLVQAGAKTTSGAAKFYIGADDGQTVTVVGAFTVGGVAKTTLTFNGGILTGVS